MKLFAAALVLCFALSVQAGNIFFARSPKGRYKMKYADAHKLCKGMGAHLATMDELKQELEDEGYEHCACGWLLNKKASYPMNSSDPNCDGKPGIHECTWSDYFDAFCYAGDSVGNCSRPLGMETKEIKDYAISSSSYYTSWIQQKWYARLARLHNTGWVNGWIPHDDNRRQFLEINLEPAGVVTGVVTQGASRWNRAQYVKSYKIQHSKDGELWKTFKDRDGVDIIFKGNTDAHTPVRNMFWTPILATHIRIYPYEWNHHILLRAELLGCDMEVYDAAEAASRDIAISSNGGIPMERPAGKTKTVDTEFFAEFAPPDDISFN